MTSRPAFLPLAPLLFTLILTAQVAPVGPARYDHPEKDRTLAAAGLQLPSLRTPLARPSHYALPTLSDGEKARPRPGVPAIGLHRRLPQPLSEIGRWNPLPDGRSIWTAAIHSPGARALRLHFSRFDAGTGRVWIHDGNPASPQISGPYTARGWTGDGDFWSDIIFADTAVIEYEPGPPAGHGAPPFEIKDIAHHTAAFASAQDPLPVELVKAAGQAGAPNREAALPCHLDASCYPEWAETTRSVARMVFEKDGGSYLCTGTLLNTRNSSKIPYFITADHCLSSDEVARTLQTFWFYQTGSCNGVAPATRDVPRALGARYLAGGDLQQGDFTLLRLNDVPSGVIFSGWDLAEPSVGAPLFGVHHPTGDFKRYSVGQRAPDSTLGGLRQDRFYGVQWTEGHTEGGSSGSGLFSAPAVLVGTLYGGFRTAAGVTKCDLNPDFSFYGRFATAYPSIKDFLEDRQAAPPPPPPPTGGPSNPTTLVSNQPANFRIGPVDQPALINAPSSLFTITVPANATRLQIRLTTRTPNADVDMYARFGQAPEVSGVTVVADHSSVGDTGEETITVTPASTPALRAGNYFIALALFTTGIAAEGAITVTVDTPVAPPPPPTGGPIMLISGQAREFTLNPVASPILLNSTASLYQVTVPQGATRVTIRLTTTTPNVDLDLFARFATAPGLQGSQIVADYRSDGPTGNEEIVITPGSSPALRPGDYLVAIGVFTTGVTIRGSVVATIETGAAPPPAGGPTILTSGQSRDFTLNPVTINTLLTAPASLYQVTVPQGATRLTIRLTTSTPNVDIDLFARFNAAPVIESERVTADHASEGSAGNEEIIVTPSSTPPLRAGTYAIAIGVFTTGVTIRGSIVATVDTAPAQGPTTLTSGETRPFSLAAVTEPRLFAAPENLFQITVPDGARRLQIRLATTTPNTDVDLHVRFGSAPTLSDGSVVADHSSEGETGSELITITSGSNPPLRPGVYIIALALFSTGVAAQGTVEAFVEIGGVVTPPGITTVTSGQLARFSFDAVTSPSLFTDDYAYKIVVPPGSSRLQIRAVSSDPKVDIDLYVRYEAPVTLGDSGVVADYASLTETGNETITISGASSPPLRPGTYYIALSLYSTGVPASGTVTATIERAVTPPPATGTLLRSGEPVAINVPAVQQPALLGGASLFRIDVPEGQQELRIALATTPSTVDLDLFVRYGAPPEVQNGRIVADHSSTGLTGDEVVVVGSRSDPPLRPGTWYIAIASFTTGATATAQLTATLRSGETLSLEKAPLDELIKRPSPLASLKKLYQ